MSFIFIILQKKVMRKRMITMLKITITMITKGTGRQEWRETSDDGEGKEKRSTT